MLLSAVSILVVAQSSSEIPEGLMNNPVYRFHNARCNNKSSELLFLLSFTIGVEMSGHNFGSDFLHVQPEATFNQADVCVSMGRHVYMKIEEILIPILIRALPITLKGTANNTVTDNTSIHSQSHIVWPLPSSEEITGSIPN